MVLTSANAHFNTVESMIDAPVNFSLNRIEYWRACGMSEDGYSAASVATPEATPEATPAATPVASDDDMAPTSPAQDAESPERLQRVALL